MSSNMADAARLRPSRPPTDTGDMSSDDEWWDEDESQRGTGSRGSRDLQGEVAASRITQWPTFKDDTKSIRTARKSVRRYSVHRPTRQKSRGRQLKQNALAGIRVITDFSKPPAAPKQTRTEVPRKPLQPRFVDLAALQALVGETQTDVSRPIKTQDQAPKQNQRPIPPPLNLRGDLSPSDRPIVIGISLPSASLTQHTTSPISPGAEKLAQQGLSPQVANITVKGEPAKDYGPTIIITPAKEISIWSPDSEDTQTPIPRARATSSIYSQATNFFGTPHMPSSREVPPVPKIPSGYDASKKSDRDSVGTVFGEDDDESPIKSRVMSSATFFEDDESPVLQRTATSTSFPEAHGRGYAGLSPIHTRRGSKGWWNYVVSPFLTRSNTMGTLASPNQTRKTPALPSLTTAISQVQNQDRDRQVWEKQFSPQTPATTTTVSSAWWSYAGSPKVAQTAVKHRAQDSSASIPVMLSAGGLGGATTLEDDKAANSAISRNTTIRSLMTPGDREVPFVFDVESINNPPQTSQQTSLRLVDVESIHSESAAIETTTNRSLSIVNEENEDTNEKKPISPSPPPYSPPRPVFQPKSLAGGVATQYPPSPGPLSPGLQNAMTTRGAIPMSDVPLTPAEPAPQTYVSIMPVFATSRSVPVEDNTPPTPRRPINLNSGYPGLPARPVIAYSSPDDFVPPAALQRQNEKRRRKYEKEDRVARKAGGLWRGRCCIPKTGCFGRGGAEGRKRRRVYCWLIALFILIIVLAVTLATTLVRKSSEDIEASQWLNLTGFPPIYTGVATIAAPENTVANTGCVFPSTMWSCALPKELQDTAYAPTQPNFRFHIQWDNSSAANATFANVTGNPNLETRAVAGNPVSAGHFIRSLLLKIRDIVEFIPSPSAPTYAEEFFLGNTTDDIVSADKAGEPTPFYISLLDTTSTVTVSTKLLKRSNSTAFPNITDQIPDPDVNSDGTAAAANLLPTFTQQPIRLYDRGLPTEHYGFYNYFDRSIFLKSITAINDTTSDEGEVPDDQNGGSTEAEASFRCTWSQTRLLVQIWTRMNTTAALLNNTTPAALTFAAGKNSSFAPNDFSQPGSFPYPVTITSDRHGGDPGEKLVYCYAMNNREQITGDGTIELENRAFGGTRINPGPSLFSSDDDDDSNSTLGGYDGGTGGCKCSWQNWVATS